MGVGEDGSQEFKTVSGEGQARIAVRGSTFIGYTQPVQTVSEAEGTIARRRERYGDATHHIPAYRVREHQAGFGMLREWSSDKGEPRGSAGKPALNILKRRELENVVVVITRFYGGTELGVGGLARAYAQATKAAVDAAGIEWKRPQSCVVFSVEYDDSGVVRDLLERFDTEFTAEYAEFVTFEALLPESESDLVIDKLRSVTSDRVDIDTG